MFNDIDDDAEEDFSEADKEFRTKKAHKSFKKGNLKEFRHKPKIQRSHKENEIET